MAASSNVTANSIRQICLRGFLAGATNASIAAEIVASHPNSAAAAKSSIHIGWHRGDMKKKGLLVNAPNGGAAVTVARTTAVVTVTPPTVEGLMTLEDVAAAANPVSDIDLLAAEMAARIDAEMEASSEA